MQQHKFKTTEDAQASYGFAQPAAAALPVPLLTDEQKAAPKPGKWSLERLTRVKERVAIERAAMNSGSPSDSDIGQEQLASMALDYLPGLIEAVADMPGLIADNESLAFEKCQAEEEAARLSRLLEEERRTASQAKADFFDVTKELRRQTEALMLAGQALADCYDVTEYPANGESSQDVALNAIRALYPQNEAAAPCQRDCQKCESAKPGWQAVFATEAEYEASCNAMAARIESGEIQPREPDADESPRPGQVWRHKKTGDEVVILMRVGAFGVNYRRHPPFVNPDFNRERKKLLHYFEKEYELAAGGAGVGLQGEPQRVGCSCGFLAQTVGDGCWKCNPEAHQEDEEAGGYDADPHADDLETAAGGLQGEAGKEVGRG